VAVRSAVVTLAAIAVLLASGCGGTAEAPPASPTEVLGRYVAAVRAGDGSTVRELLSDDFVGHYDLDVRKLEAEFIPAVRSNWGPLGRTLGPAFERRLGDELAIAALSDRGKRRLPGPRALAEPLVLEDGEWKVEPFGVDISYGYPDDLSADSRRPFVTFGVNAAGEPEARLWIDGRELPLRRRQGRPVTFEGRPARPLAAGRHVVVAFAKVGDRVGALAWLATVE
jgi:hypothetical protein